MFMKRAKKTNGKNSADVVEMECEKKELKVHSILQAYIESLKLKNRIEEKFFKLGDIADNLQKFDLICEDTKYIVIEHFGNRGLTPKKYIAHIELLREYMVNEVNRFISSVRVYDEMDCARLIPELIRAGKSEEAVKYSIRQRDCKEYAIKMISIIDSAVSLIRDLKFEVLKLGNSDADNNTDAILHEMETLIRITKFYV